MRPFNVTEAGLEGAEAPFSRLRTLLQLSIPIMGGMVSQSLLNLVDTAMVGHLGSDALAAIGTANYAIFVCFALISGLSVGVQSRVARLQGLGAMSRLREPLDSGIRIALFASIPLTALLFFCTPSLFDGFQISSSVAEQTKSYFTIRILSLPAGMLMLCFRGFWNGSHSPWSYLQILVVIHVLNAALSYLLIFGKFGLPQMNLNGAALGTLIAMYAGALLNIFKVSRSGYPSSLSTAASRPDNLRSFFQQAWPDSAQQTFFALGLLTFFWLVSGLGAEAMAITLVLANISLLMILPGIGMGMASTTLINHSLGAGNHHRAWRWGMDVSFAALALMTLLSLPLLFFPEAVLGFFLPQNAQLATAGKVPLQLMAISVIADSSALVLTQSLLGTGCNRVVMKIRFSTLWLFGLPVTALAVHVFHLGLAEVWGIQALQRLITSLLCLYVWHQCSWCKTTRI